jgi:hypothetical protein
MSNSAEKLVKQTLKAISKLYDLDYEELKVRSKKIIRSARNFDEEILGMMEELIDLGDVGSEKELADFNIEVLKIYCRIKDIDDSGSEKAIRARVWEQFEDEDESEDESVVDSEDESDTEEVVIEKVKNTDEKPKRERKVKIVETD